MADKTVKIKVCATEVTAGREYNGKISFDEIEFAYRMELVRSFYELGQMAAAQNPAEATKFVKWHVEDSKGRVVVLDDQTQTLFAATAGSVAAELYDNRSQRVCDFSRRMADRMGYSIDHELSCEYRMPRTPQFEQVLKKLTDSKRD